MFKISTKETQWGGRTLKLETGLMARQADGAVVVTYGGTQLLCTVVAAKTAKPEQDFFPLTVNYQEKFYATGRIPGGFFKREGRPTERETLVSRLVDRPIRPLFHERFLNETQVICTVLSHDQVNDPDILAVIGASAALAISGVPFLGPVAAAKVGYKGGKFILNPTIDQIDESQLDLVVAGTAEGVLMVESEAQQLPEEVMLQAVVFGHKAMQVIIDMIVELAEEAAKEPWVLPAEDKRVKVLKPIIEKASAKKLVKAFQIKDKQERYAAIDAIRSEVNQAILDKDPEIMAEAGTAQIIAGLFKKCESEVVRGTILEGKPRIDGRNTTQIRPIDCRVGVINRTHGSALFTRGETQALVVTTLGTGTDAQMIDAIEGEYKESFMLHYNFPPFSVGETGKLGSPGRREVGHGKLAWRAIRPVLPTQDEFSYILRIVSEITESNGSSSMATVCGSSLSLMDAGVPIKKPVAGIAMGLIKEGEDYSVLSDILGDEDHLGDMDFKVAGTEDGVTSLQMDLKITSITPEIMKIALDQAREGRMHILGEMAKAITESRDTVNEHAPRLLTMSIPKDKIREVIGTGGKVIREIIESTGAKIDIDDDGKVVISSTDANAGEAARVRIFNIVAEPEEGTIYRGKVVQIKEFGAFVNFLGSKDGLVHVSMMADDRVNHPSDIVSEGEEVWVKFIGTDDRGKIKLSMKHVDQATGEAREVADNGDSRPPRPDRPRSDRGFGDRPPRRDDRGGDHRGGDRGGDRGGRFNNDGDDRPQRRPREFDDRPSFAPRGDRPERSERPSRPRFNDDGDDRPQRAPRFDRGDDFRGRDDSRPSRDRGGDDRDGGGRSGPPRSKFRRG